MLNSRGDSDQVAQIPQVLPDGRLDEVRDAGVAVLPAGDDLLDLLGQGLGQVDRVILIFSSGHSVIIQTS